MIIPIPMQIRHRNEGGTPPIANYILIGINVFVYIFFSPETFRVGPGTMPWTILTYGFAHAYFLHLLFNMWFLWVFGTPVNRRIGNGWYALTYLGTVISIGLIARLLSSGYCLGSSGAVFAVIAIASMLMPRAKVELHYLAFFPLTILIGLFRPPKFWLFWFFRWGSLDISAFVLAACYVMFEVFIFLLMLLFGGLSWTNFGHLLGFACGVGAVLLMPQAITMGRRVTT